MKKIFNIESLGLSLFIVLSMIWPNGVGAQNRPSITTSITNLNGVAGQLTYDFTGTRGIMTITTDNPSSVYGYKIYMDCKAGLQVVAGADIDCNNGEYLHVASPISFPIRIINTGNSTSTLSFYITAIKYDGTLYASSTYTLFAPKIPTNANSQIRMSISDIVVTPYRDIASPNITFDLNLQSSLPHARWDIWNFCDIDSSPDKIKFNAIHDSSAINNHNYSSDCYAGTPNGLQDYEFDSSGNVVKVHYKLSTPNLNQRFTIKTALLNEYGSRLDEYGFGQTAVILNPASSTLNSLLVSINPISPTSTSVSVGQSGATFAVIDLRAQNRDINNINGIQIASDSAGSQNLLKTIRVYDGSTLLAVSTTSLVSNGSYYYKWLNVSNLSIPAGSTHSLRLVADIANVRLSTSTLRLGIAGLNFDQTGVMVSGLPVYGSYMYVVPNRLAIQPTTSCYYFTLNMSLGSKGPEVLALQKFLNSKGYSIENTGYFWIPTKSAVISYQSSKGLPATGYVGSLTRDQMNIDCGNSTTTPIVTISNPKKGDIYYPGQQIVVKYSVSGFPRPVNVQIQLNKGAVYPNGPYNPVYYSATYVPATGSYLYTVPANMYSGSDYSFMISTDYPNTNSSTSGHSEEFTINPATTTSPIIAEKVKCVFNGSNNMEKCYTATSTSSSSWFTCSGISSCTVDVQGIQGTRLTWKNSCDSSSLFITNIDGNNKYLNFQCGNNIINQSVVTATLRANGSRVLTVKAGDTINYSWNSTGGVSASSNYSTNNQSQCGGPGSWIANSLNGGSVIGSNPKYDGCIWTVNYTVIGANGQKAVDTLIVSQIYSTSTASTSTSTTSSNTNPVGSATSLRFVSCSPDSSSIDLGKSVTWTALASGGTSPYRYLWNDGATSTDYSSINRITRTYLNAGTKTMRVSIIDSRDNKVEEVCGSVNVKDIVNTTKENIIDTQVPEVTPPELPQIESRSEKKLYTASIIDSILKFLGL